MHSRRYGVVLHRALWFVLMLLLCSMIIMPYSWNRIHAAEENEADLEQLYARLKSGERVWKDKAYVKPEKPTVYLTFDDGPSKLTSKVLDILREEDVKATFFVIGASAADHPDLVRQVVEEGHAIGNHTYNHVYKELYTNVETFWNQIQKTEQIVKEATGVRTKLVRAPGGTFGNFDAFYFYYLDQAGYEVYDWNMDSGDSKRVGVPASEILQTVQKGPFGKQVVLLMHDGTGHDQTVKALPDIIRLFKEKGYAFASLTPEVQPNQFRAGSLTYPRSLSESKFHQLQVKAREHQELIAMEESAAKPNAAVSVPTPARTVVSKMPVELAVQGTVFELKPEQAHLQAGNYEVPLRALAQAIGGQVEWKEAQRTAVLRQGGMEVSYDFTRYEQRVREGGFSATYHLPNMELREGMVWVPLRSTIELLGGRISSYGEQDGRMRIGMELRPGFPVQIWRSSPSGK